MLATVQAGLEIFLAITRKVIAVYCANTQENYSTKQQLKTEIILRPLYVFMLPKKE